MADLSSGSGWTVFEGVSRGPGIFDEDHKYWQDRDCVLVTGKINQIGWGARWHECVHVRRNELIWIADQDWSHFVQMSTVRE